MGEKNPMEEQDIIQLGCDMCSALELCHKNNIIHRDIKPQNIFVNRHGNFKLGDFGIARVVDRTNTVLSTKGTYTYMAPEVFKGEHYDETADIYSLGIVLYRYLNNNRTPFLPMGSMTFSDRDSARDRRMAGEAIPAPMNGSAKLKLVVLTALQYDPQKRFQSAEEFKKALEFCKSEQMGDALWKKQDNQPIDEMSKEELPAQKRLEEPKSKEKGIGEENTEEEKTTFVEPRKHPKEKSKKKNHKWFDLVGIFLGIGIIVSVVLIVGILTKNESETDIPKQPENIVQEQSEEIEIKPDLQKYQNMTYSQFKEMTGVEVDYYWRDNVFGGDIPNTNLSIAFRASYFNMDDWYQLQEHDICYRLEGTLGALLDGIEGEMTISELENALSQGTVAAKTEYGEGYAGVQTLSEVWAVITFDSNQDGQYDAAVHADITEKNTVNAETLAWVVLDLRDNHSEVLGWE